MALLTKGEPERPRGLALPFNRAVALSLARLSVLLPVRVPVDDKLWRAVVVVVGEKRCREPRSKYAADGVSVCREFSSDRPVRDV